jgi:hypothetical protein
MPPSPTPPVRITMASGEPMAAAACKLLCDALHTERISNSLRRRQKSPLQSRSGHRSGRLSTTSILVLLQQLRWCLLLLLLLLGHCVPTSRYFSSNLDWARNLLFFLVLLYPIINETNENECTKCEKEFCVY